MKLLKQIKWVLRAFYHWQMSPDWREAEVFDLVCKHKPVPIHLVGEYVGQGMRFVPNKYWLWKLRYLQDPYGRSILVPQEMFFMAALKFFNHAIMSKDFKPPVSRIRPKVPRRTGRITATEARMGY